MGIFVLFFKKIGIFNSSIIFIKLLKPQRWRPMSDIFNEIDEELKREKLENLWREYGKTIIAMAVIIVLSTALWVGMKNWRISSQQSDTSALLDVLEKNDISALQDFAKDQDGVYEAIAAFHVANKQLASSDMDVKKQASLTLQSIVDNGGLDQFYRDYASFLLTQYGDKAAAEKMAVWDQLIDSESGLKALALEQRAVLHAQAGDYQKALDDLAVIVADDKSSFGLIERATALQRVFKAQLALKTDTKTDGQ